MMRAVRGIYRDGVVELLEEPNVSGEAEVVVTFLRAVGTIEIDEDLGAPQRSITEDAPPLDDFEPIVPATPVRLSDLVLEDRGGPAQGPRD
jgi:hypothetical protein